MMQHKHINTRCSGLSLLELSVVILIIGLIMGGILIGTSLVRASELNSVISDRQKYISAMNSFQVKFAGLPGDITNATKYWGENCTATPATGTETCNGNGDSRISHCYMFHPQVYETFLFWQHLANAGMISGRFTGVRGAGGVADSYAGINVPAAEISDSGWEITFLSSQYPDCVAGYTPNASTIDKNVLVIGAKRAGNQYEDRLLPAVEARSIDAKIDDAKPFSGAVHIAQSFALASCVSGLEYGPSTTGRHCNLVFLMK